MERAGQPFGFVKFVIVTTLLLNAVRVLLTGEFNVRQTSMIPFAIILWLGYRLARTQSWWPFSQGSHEYKQVKIPQAQNPNDVNTLVKPISSDYKRTNRNNRAKNATNRTTQNMPNIRSSPLMSEAISQMKHELKHEKKSEVLKSDLGVREIRVRRKCHRTKTVRHKTSRSKRRSELLPQ